MENTKFANEDLATLSSVLLASLDESVFFSQLCRYLKDHFQVENVLAYKALNGFKTQLVAQDGHMIEDGEVFEKGENLASYVVTTKRPYFSNSIERDPLFAQFKREESHQAELSIPVSSEGTVLATIHFISNSKENPFSQRTINEILEIFKFLERPINNIKMYLSAKHLNETLLRKIEDTQRELASRMTNIKLNQNYKIKEEKILGNSEPIKEIIDFVDKIAPTDSSVLILGESGTGKELVARKIHCSSKRRENSYVVVNCGAIQESLLESEFFGHEKGSFTGAIAMKEGLVEKANGGTLFLDEVAELSPGMQTKLLRFLEHGEAYRVGGMNPYRVNVRIIAATNKDLKKAVEDGQFREDLFYRLNAITIKVPPLRVRGDDIIVMANYFLNEQKPLMEQKSLTPGAINALRSYGWPGNIRELKNVMERAYILSDGKFIDESSLTECASEEPRPLESNDQYLEITLADLEKRHIVKTLDHLNGNKTKTAKALGITVKTLYNKLHSYGMIQSRDVNL